MSPIQKAILTVLAASCLAVTAGSAATNQTVSTNKLTSVEMFKDVPTDHWAYDAIYELIQNGVIIGYADQPANKFRGDKPLSRYEFAYAMAKAIIQIEENIRKDKTSSEIQEYLRNRNANPKDIELMDMLMKEFKTELNELDIRTTRLEGKKKKSGGDNVPLYLSIGAVVLSAAALTMSLQK